MSIETCTYCDRPIAECDDEPYTDEDRWSYSRDEHYTITVTCPGAEERAEDGRDYEPDYDGPDESDLAADEWERGLPMNQDYP